MKINEIKYSRVFNLGNYENETISISAFVEEGEDASKALQDVKDFVLAKKGHRKPEMIAVQSEHVPSSAQDQSSAASNQKQVSGHRLADYEIKMGKYKGRRLGSFATDEIPKLDNYVEWLVSDAANKNKKITGPAKELVDAYKEYFFGAGL